MKGCPICGGKMVEIRPRHPGGERRTVCPTCLADRLEQIFTIANPQTYQPMKAKEE